MSPRELLLSLAGPILAGYLEDPQITDIMCNDNGSCFVTSLSRGKEERDHPDFPLVDYPQMPYLDRFMAVVAHLAGGVWSSQEPRLSVALADLGWRFQAQSPPMCTAPIVSIRKHVGTVFAFEKLVADGMFTAQQAALLREAVLTHQRMVFAGNVGSGKTTVLNTCLALLKDSPLRAVILADDPEVISEIRNCVRYWRVKGQTTLRDLVQDALRHNGDLLIIEEVRGGEALDCLRAFQTGHSGMVTLHVDKAEHGLLRLQQLVGEASAVDQRELIGQVIDLVVALHRAEDGTTRRCTGIMKVQGWDAATSQYRQERIA